jgi:hypothetical protein
MDAAYLLGLGEGRRDAGVGRRGEEGYEGHEGQAGQLCLHGGRD